ncbi:hypothetical protein [Melittangium boletus]|uniref:Uncharacterized protein n=1 Tax=Melittangium boletus DSM 14713 TaxID=1294270 RepID=A0A250IFE0_9BACT|nr:hypothetical protein [Melittangium boletus]ATB29958.1 hypothetical protein MEBOL_003413 [Melittangium boletus DSM 14713]
MDLQLAYTAIPRRTAGFRLVSEPRPELLQGKGVPREADKAAVGPAPKPAPGRAVGKKAAPAPVVRDEPEGRRRLRAAIMDRLGRDMADVLQRLDGFLTSANTSRSGIVNLSLVLSESFVAQELWKEPRRSPEARARLEHALGLGPQTDPATLVRTLVTEVHQAFGDFRESRPGLEARQRYEDMLARYERCGVVLVMAGHDSGPMHDELQRLGVTAEPDFTRSLLLDERVLAVGPGSARGAPSQVMVAGLSTTQLGMVVAQLRQLNPRLTNRQLRHVLATVLNEVRAEQPRTLGRAQVERLQELARQLLRLQVTGYLCA